jgi:hypothetical protein
MRQLSAILLSVAFLGSVGCTASRGLTAALAPKATVDTAPLPSVTKIVCLWEPGVGKVPNGPRRGVLGQVLFFTAGDSASSKVDGTVTVYLFDDHGTVAEQTQPVHKMVLSSQDLEAVYAETAVGHSYHIPVPYPKNHGMETTCTMRVKYTSPAGEVTYSDLNSVRLDGAARKSKISVTRKSAPVSEEAAKTIAGRNVRRIGETEIHEASAGADQLKSLTIRRKQPFARQTKGQAPAVSTPARPRKRFQLSNTKPDPERSGLSANDFAPMD